LAARWFSRLFFRMPARHTLGLTATPNRKDGCTSALHLFLGPCAYLAEAQQLRALVLRLFLSPARSGEVLSHAQVERLKTRLGGEPARNALLAALCARAAATGRRTLLLAHRLQHLRALAALVPGSALYVGGMSAAARASATGATVLLATFSMAAEGLDLPHLDTLILASPAADVVQAAGRILRPCAGKGVPVVLDIIDGAWVNFRRCADARRTFYRRADFAVRDFEDADALGSALSDAAVGLSRRESPEMEAP
jgi:superfamily II DNA or RNA helicase